MEGSGKIAVVLALFLAVFAMGLEGRSIKEVQHMEEKHEAKVEPQTIPGLMGSVPGSSHLPGSSFPGFPSVFPGSMPIGFHGSLPGGGSFPVTFPGVFGALPTPGRHASSSSQDEDSKNP